MRTVQFVDTITINLPHSWREDIIAIYSNGETLEDAVSVVLRRSMVSSTVTLSDYADLQLVELAKSLPTFALVGRKELVLNRAPAFQLTYTWNAQGGRYSQTQTILRDSPETMVCVITSCSARNALTLEKEFTSIIQSLVLRNSHAQNTKG